MNDDTDIQIPRRHDDGRKVYIVGPVERWIMVIVAMAVLGSAGRLLSQMDSVVATSVRMELAQAVTNSEMNEIKAKQTLMQQEVSKIPRLEIQSSTNAQDIRDIKQAEGLK